MYKSQLQLKLINLVKVNIGPAWQQNDGSLVQKNFTIQFQPKICFQSQLTHYSALNSKYN